MVIVCLHMVIELIYQIRWKLHLSSHNDVNFFSSYLGQDASFAFSRAFSAGFQFNLKERKGWYICRSSNKTHHRADLEADFHLDNINWLRRCAFVLRPLSATESPRMNCFGTNKPPHPPHPTDRPTTKPTPVKTISSTPKTLPTTATPHKPKGKVKIASRHAS